MKRDDGGNATTLRLVCPAERRRRNYADVTVGDVDAFVRQRVSDGADTGCGTEKPEPRSEGGGDPPHANALHVRTAGRWCDDDYLMSRGGEVFRQILKVQLDTTDPWMIPVAHQSNLQGAIPALFE